MNSFKEIAEIPQTHIFMKFVQTCCPIYPRLQSDSAVSARMPLEILRSAFGIYSTLLNIYFTIALRFMAILRESLESLSQSLWVLSEGIHENPHWRPQEATP